MNIGIFGGSFDPPHVGHLWATAYSLAMFGLDEIWVIPCYKHVYGKQLTPFNHRFEMCRRSFVSFSQIRVSPMEQLLYNQTKKPNFTADTLEYIKRNDHYKEINLSLIVGEDIAREIEKWDGYERIIKVAKILRIPREEKAIPELGSTNIRDEIKKGKMPDKILTPKVLDYIIENNLYGAIK